VETPGVPSVEPERALRRAADDDALPSWLVRGGFLLWAAFVYLCYWLWLAQGARSASW
jgi:hypothetical protein